MTKKLNVWNLQFPGKLTDLFLSNMLFALVRCLSNEKFDFIWARNAKVKVQKPKKWRQNAKKMKMNQLVQILLLKNILKFPI